MMETNVSFLIGAGGCPLALFRKEVFGQWRRADYRRGELSWWWSIKHNPMSKDSTVTRQCTHTQCPQGHFLSQLLSFLNLPACVVGSGGWYSERQNAMECVLLALNSRSGDSSPSPNKLALLPHLKEKLISRGAVGVNTGLLLWYEARKNRLHERCPQAWGFAHYYVSWDYYACPREGPPQNTCWILTERSLTQ